MQHKGFMLAGPAFRRTVIGMICAIARRPGEREHVIVKTSGWTLIRMMPFASARRRRDQKERNDKTDCGWSLPEHRQMISHSSRQLLDIAFGQVISGRWLATRDCPPATSDSSRSASVAAPAGGTMMACHFACCH